MKNIKKILALLFAFLFAFSCFALNASALESKEDASSTINIYVTPPSVGRRPSSSDIGKSNNLLVLMDYTWGERAPGESSFHVMRSGDSFKEGYQYMVVIDYGSPDASLPYINIKINGNNPTNRSDDNAVYGSVSYNFGKLGGSGSSGGNGGGGGFFGFILSILSLPIYLITFPFTILFSIF